MRIVAISDTHEQETNLGLSAGDMLVHAGDWTYKGSDKAIERFVEWLVSQPHPHKVFVAGNHELHLDKGIQRQRKLDIIRKVLAKTTNVHYLENSGITIEGIKIYGSPASPFFYNWSFNYHRGADIADVWRYIPDDTNLLVTHSPPYGILDEAPQNFGLTAHVGCEELLKTIGRLKDLKAHVFGHVHSGYGMVQQENNGIKFINASTCTEKYKPTNPPIVFDI